MARPPLPLGTYGRIFTIPLPAGGFRARAKYRDYDGVTRRVERVGVTETAAADNLRIALRDRGRVPSDGDITADTKIKAVAVSWFREINESDLAHRTKVTYREVWDNLLVDVVGSLRIRDIGQVSRVDKVIRAIREHNGPGRAKHAKTVLSGICGLAVRHDALADNPVFKLGRSRSRKKKTRPIVLTEMTFAGLRAHVHESQIARDFDLVDVVDVLSGLGCRIGELLALDWTKVDVAAGTLAIEGTVIRVAGVGLVVQHDTKSSAGTRTIAPPAWVMGILKRRYAARRCAWVFPSPTRPTLRDPDNTRAKLRQVVEGTDWVGLALRYSGWVAEGDDRITGYAGAGLVTVGSGSLPAMR
ncbi:MAG TPA: site-specific integrase [Pseudonocardiaceae bacterium]|jgi:integrase|nr:site-specific integrase [Pseudonocardiaceae bacterium]